jgi:Bacteriocin-protection, YdeI or OmpD-Associated/Domain of unknown function (DUF1905)
VTFEAEVAEFGPALAIDLPFDPKVELGQVRAPVRVTINGFEFQARVARMSGRTVIGMNKEVRAGTGVSAGDRVTVELELDEEPRVVDVPADLAAALSPEAHAFLDSLAFTHRKEYVRWIEEAKRSETRQARITKAAAMLADGVRHP